MYRYVKYLNINELSFKDYITLYYPGIHYSLYNLDIVIY